MGISQFPPAASGGGLSNDFILNRNNSTNNTFLLPREFEAGGYALTTSDNDSSFDIYLINAAGSSVGYTNGSSIVATDVFDTVVALGLGTATTVQFEYRGPSTNATTQGLEPGAGAYLVGLTPSDLPNIDDTTIVSGGNFATNVSITFESGTVVLPAKNVVVGSSTALVVTRPDNLIQDNSPYSLRAVNPGVTPPSIGINVLTGTVTAGADPTFITTSPLLGAGVGTAFSTSIAVSDSDGTVVNWAITAGTLPPGLALATATGVISGTPTTGGDYTFTVRITDDGQNTNTREYNLPIGPIITGQNSTVVGGTTYVWWTSSGTLTYKNVTGKSLEYVAIAGGGGGGSGGGGGAPGGGGGGAGGVLIGTITPTASTAITIGAGGAAPGGFRVSGDNGTNTTIAGFATAIGGGGGGGYFEPGKAGGSGGGAGGSNGSVGTATAGQGNAGGSGSGLFAGGGGGRGEAGNTDGNAHGGDGTALGAWASAINIIYNGGLFAGGGAGGANFTAIAGGDGGGGNNTSGVGSANSGGGGGSSANSAGGAGGSGLVVVRFT